MTNDDDSMYARPTGTRMERATEIMSRAHCMQSAAGETEDQIEARQAADRARAFVHDRYFAADYVSIGGPVQVTRRLAAMLGFDVEPADNGGNMGQMGDPDQSPRPVLNYGDDE